MKELDAVDSYIFKDLFLASPVASYICDPSGKIVAYNKAAVTLWGGRPDSGSTKWSGVSALYFPDGRLMEPEESPMAIALTENIETADLELVMERADGTRRNVLVFAKPVWSPSGELMGGYNSFVDISDYRSYEEKQAILSEIVQSADDAIVSKNLDGIIMSWNSGAERIFGYSEEEVVGKSIKLLIPDYLKNEEETILREISEGRKVDHYQTIRVTKAGREIPVSLTISPMRNRRGTIVGASKIARDISEQIQREQTIQFHEQHLETLHAIGRVISEKSDTPSIIQTVINSTTQLVAANAGLCFYRVADEEGRANLSVAVSAGESSASPAGHRIHLEDGIIHTIFVGEEAVRFSDIREVPHVLSLFELSGYVEAPFIRHCLAIPIRSADKLLIGAMFFGYNQSDPFNGADERMMRNIVALVAVTLDNARLFDEVNALNQRKNEFIALASHELKTPLTTTKGYLQILERSEIDQVGRRFLTKALKQLERINALIAELLDISKIEAGKLSFHMEEFDLSEMILDVVETFHFSSKTHTIFVNKAQGDYQVEADRQRMEQVMINLITNAIKYSPEANNVHVMLEASSSELRVQVRDEGLGMTRDQQEKVFARFYQVEGTTKMAGLGLGLYLSKEIIDRHGGHIGVTSQLGEGSTFYFAIPRSQHK